MPIRKYVRDSNGRFADAFGGQRPQGKETAQSVGRRMADALKPLAPAGPPPPTKTRRDFPSHQAFAYYLRHVYPGSPAAQAHDEYDARLKNDPAFHSLMAAVLNSDRVSRRREKREPDID